MKVRDFLPPQKAPERGQALAEFAMIAPLLMILLMGLVDLARLMESHVAIQEAARDAARYAVTGRIDCAGPPVPNRNSCILQTVIDDTASLTNASTINTSVQSWKYPAYAEPPTPNDPGQQCDAVQVKVTYDYEPITPLFKFFVRHVPLTASERMVNEPFGPCG